MHDRVTDLYFRRFHELCGAKDYVNAFALKLLWSLEPINRLYRTAHVVANLHHIDPWCVRDDSVVRSSSYLMSDFCCLQQRFAGNASGPGTIAANSIPLRKRNSGSKLRGKP